MNYECIEYTHAAKIAWITLSRPQYRNAQSTQLLTELNTAFQAAEHDDSVHVIVLRGKGAHFSAGHDLGTPEEMETRARKPFGTGTIGQITRSWYLYVESALRWRDIKKPTIAAVQGYCISGGYLIASCMDLIIAADDAMFLPSHLQLNSAPYDLGIRKAKQILFENRFIHAAEAMALGLVTEVVPPDRLQAATLAQAERIAENDLLTLRMLKQSINGAQDAMGFRNHVHAAHSSYMVQEMAGAIIAPDAPQIGEMGASKRLGMVAAALAKERKPALPST